MIDYEYLSRIRRAVALYTKRKTSNILDGDFHSLHRGRSMEFDDLKEYAYGDDVHDIDWKSSSRMGTILVRRYMTDRRHNVMFICDRGPGLLGDTTRGENKCRLISMAFGTVAYLCGRNGADVAIAYPGERSATVSLFKSGSDHLERLMYDYAQRGATECGYSLTDTVKEVLDTIHKRMIIFIMTDMEGLSKLDEGIVSSITREHDLFVVNIDDAYLTGDNVFDSERSRYERFFLSHSRRLHQEEVRIRSSILENTSEILKRNKAVMCTISCEEEIIDSTISLFERYRNGNFG